MQTATMSLGTFGTAAQRSTDAADDFDLLSTQPLMTEGDRTGTDMMFSNIAGVVLQSEQDRFARTLFRATRGNTFTHFQPISEPVKDPKTGKEVLKSVFVVYYQDNRLLGGGASAMSDKIKKI